MRLVTRASSSGDFASSSAIKPRSSFGISGVSFLEPVRRSRIVIENFFLHCVADFGLVPEDFYGVHFAGSVGVAKVRANDDVVFAGVLQHVRKVVVGLGGDVNLKLLARILRESFGARAPNGFIDYPRYPLGGSFDEGPTQFRKEGWDFAHHQRQAGDHGRNAELREAAHLVVAWFELIHELRTAVGDMDSDGHAEAARFFIDRIEIRFDEMLVVFEGEKAGRDGAPAP